MQYQQSFFHSYVKAIDPALASALSMEKDAYKNQRSSVDGNNFFLINMSNPCTTANDAERSPPIVQYYFVYNPKQKQNNWTQTYFFQQNWLFSMH